MEILAARVGSPVEALSMRGPIRLGGPILALLLAAGIVSAADQKQIDAAVQKGTAFLQNGYKNGLAGAPGARFGGGAHGIGPPALVGIALLESGVPIDDPALKFITAAVRDQSFRETRTYQVSLCLLYLDRLGDPVDEGIIQMLGVRLLAGQNNQGGWTYDSVGAINAQDEQRLRAALKNKPPDGKLHPDVEQYYAALWKARTPNNGDDNSNTQFAVLAVWVARRHAVPVEAALDAVEKRFLNSQNPQDGGWAYGGVMGHAGASSGSMTCAGLLGLATGIARREERRNPPKKDAPPKDPKNAKANDPFYNPPPKADTPAGKKLVDPKRPLDARDVAAQRALQGLGAHYVNMLRAHQAGKPAQSIGHSELYFLWSVERVGVIFGVEQLGGVNWYDAGADHLVRTQKQDGSWPGTYEPEVDTSFAVLFLLRSNLVRDMASKVRQDTTELRAGTGPGTGDAGKPAAGTGGTIPPPKDPGLPPLPPAVEDEATKLAGELLRAAPADWAKAVERFRDTKGGDYTKAMVVAIHRLDGEKQKEIRQALAERLTRMTADTLRTMMKSEDRELRRAAVLAAAMKDDKLHVPDLIDRLTDDEELVVRAAKAGLKSLTGQDFGPAADATRDQRKAAADAWRAWWARQKK